MATPPKRSKLAYGKQWIDASDIAAVTEALQGDWLTNGPTVKAFETALAEYCGVKHAIACSSGTAALHVAMLALGVGPGQVGVTSPLSFIASANAFAYVQATPEFVDIDPATRIMSVPGLKQYLATHPVPAVVTPVSFSGVPAPLPEIAALGRQHGFRVVEDAAHSLGSTYQHEGKTYHSGSCAHSDMAILSFHPVKNITTAEGGAVMTNDDELARLTRLYMCHGMNREFASLPPDTGGWYWEMQVLGYNYRLSDIHSALGLSQLKRLNGWRDRRQEIARAYDAGFAKLKDRLITPPWPAHTSPCFHMYVIETTGAWAHRRKELFEALKPFDIIPNVHYMPIHLHPYYRTRYGYKPGDFPHAEQFYRGCISLPMYPRLTDADVARVIEAVTTTLTA